MMWWCSRERLGGDPGVLITELGGGASWGSQPFLTVAQIKGGRGKWWNITKHQLCDPHKTRHTGSIHKYNSNSNRNVTMVCVCPLIDITYFHWSHCIQYSYKHMSRGPEQYTHILYIHLMALKKNKRSWLWQWEHYVGTHLSCREGITGWHTARLLLCLQTNLTSLLSIG